MTNDDGEYEAAEVRGHRSPASEVPSAPTSPAVTEKSMLSNAKSQVPSPSSVASLEDALSRMDCRMDVSPEQQAELMKIIWEIEMQEAAGKPDPELSEEGLNIKCPRGGLRGVGETSSSSSNAAADGVPGPRVLIIPHFLCVV